ncbi:MAG: hypothetical protein CMJ40_02120 [Phycisphaerae bacterium]|nr:hypothetical protein [Phycisphaerae bacterium]
MPKKKKKKSARVNYRMLTIIGLLVFMGVAIIGGLLFLRLKGNVDRNLRTANEYYEAGDLKKAAGYYGRVLNKQPGNVEATNKLLEVWAQRYPETPQQASEMYQRYLQLLQQAALHAPMGEEEAKAATVLEEHYRAALLTGDQSFWRLLRDVASNIINRLPENTDVVARAYYIRGSCDLLLEDEKLTDNIDGLGNIRFPGESDLEKHLELVPDSDIGLAKLAFGRMAVARRLGLESRYAQEERNLAIAKETFDKAVETNPQGVYTVLEILRDAYVDQLWHIGKNIREPGSISPEKLQETRDKVEDSLATAELIVSTRAIDNESAVMDIVRYLRLADGFEGEARSQKILEKAIEVNPDNDRFRYNLAKSQYAGGDYESTLDTAIDMIEMESKPVSLEARTQWGYKKLAAKLAFDTQHALFNMQTDSDRTAEYEQLIRFRDKLRELIGGEENNPMLLEADAKIAMADREYAKAAGLFEKVIAQGNPSAITLRQAARALEQNGQNGLAEQRLQDAITAYPSDLRNHLQLAELYGRIQAPAKGVALFRQLPPSVIERNQILANTYDALKIMEMDGGDIPDDISDTVLVALSQADRAIDNEDVIAAQQLLLDEMSKSGSDIRLLVGLAHAYSMGGDLDQSQAYIEQAIEQQPNSERLKLLRVRYGDPIEGVKFYCKDRYDDPLECDAMIHENLRTLAKVREQLAESARDQSLFDRAEKHLEVAAAAREAMKEYQAAAESAIDTVAGAYIGRFEEYLAEGRFKEAREMLPKAREKNFDKVEGNLAEARLELAIAAYKLDNDEDPTESIARGISAAQRATEMAAWSDLAWRTLAWGYELNSEIQNAERAYEESFRLNPTSAATLQKYVMLLLRPDGDSARALAVLRESSQKFSTNQKITNLWLEAEARFGDPGIVFNRRTARWKERPEDRDNAIRLAALLAMIEPTHEMILSENGKRMVTARQWLGMSATRQAELLGKLQSRWDEIMDEILEQIETEEDEDFYQAIMHARIYIDRQLSDKAAGVLRRYLDKADTRTDLSVQTMASAQFLIDNERVGEAIGLLQDGLDTQSEKREIDAALGSVLYSQGKYKEAIPHLEAAIAVPDSDVVMRDRLIESYLKNQQFDKGRRELAALKDIGGRPFEVAMLEAFLSERESTIAGARGDATAEKMAIDEYRNHLRNAIGFDADQSRPYELLARSLLSEYIRTRDQRLLDEAESVLDGASVMARGDENLILIKADIHQASNNTRAAVLDMEEFLRSNPTAQSVRERLVTAHMDSGSPDRAEDVIRAAVVLEPESSVWLEMLGDFMVKKGDIYEATKAYTESFNLQPSIRLLARLNDVTRSTERWDHDAALKMVQTHQRILGNNAFMQSIQAKALARVRANAQAKARIKLARDTYLKAFQSGDLSRVWLPGWYEDVQVVFSNEDPKEGESFALNAIEGDPTIEDLAGMALYWSRWDSPETWDKALEWQNKSVEKARRDSPDRVVEALSMLGALELESGRNSEAEKTYRQIVELSPGDSMALNNYSYLLATLSNDPQKALPYAEEAISLAPDNPAIIDTMATIQEKLGNYDVALAGRLKQLDYRPQDAEVLASIALLYSDHSETPEKAIQFAEQASRLRPRDAAIMDVEGWAYFKAGQGAKGEDLVSQSIRRQATPRAHLHLAEIYLSQNRVEKAREQVRLAMEIADDDAMKAKAEALQRQLASGG